MIKKFKFYLAIAVVNAALCLPFSSLQAAFTIKDGKLVDASLIATMPLEGHYGAGIRALEESDWREAAYQFGIAATNFPLSPFGQEAAFFQGVALYHLEEYDVADEAFTAYLQGKSTPRLFEETIQYKFNIAEKFRNGAKRHLLGTKHLPKWGSGDDYAVKIYDEVIAAVPSHEFAVQSLFSKGLLHWNRKEFANAVDCFQLVIRRFPKHEYAPESYLLVNKVYLDQCRQEFQNPDLLSFAEINLRRFTLSFPGEERLNEAENDLLAIKETFALGYYATGQFYERVGKPRAAMLYYRHAVIQFPETHMANLSNRRLATLGFEVICETKDSSEVNPMNPMNSLSKTSSTSIDAADKL